MTNDLEILYVISDFCKTTKKLDEKRVIFEFYLMILRKINTFVIIFSDFT